MGKIWGLITPNIFKMESQILEGFLGIFPENFAIALRACLDPSKHNNPH